MEEIRETKNPGKDVQDMRRLPDICLHFYACKYEYTSLSSF